MGQGYDSRSVGLLKQDLVKHFVITVSDPHCNFFEVFDHDIESLFTKWVSTYIPKL